MAWPSSADGSTAFVAVGVANEVARVDVDSQRRSPDRCHVGREPRGIALSPDDSRLLVGNCPVAGRLAHRRQGLDGPEDDPDRRRQPAAGRHQLPTARRDTSPTCGIARFPTTRNNIDLGWVLGQRLTRVPLDDSESFGTLSLDTQGKAASDAHGVAVSHDEKFLAISCGGTHEVMIFRTDLQALCPGGPTARAT